MASPCAVALFLMLQHRSAASTAVCAGSSDTNVQRSPIRLAFHVSELASSRSPLHLQYSNWHAKAFNRHDVGGVPRFEAQGPHRLGTLGFGVTFGTARLCHLQAFELYVPAAHTFEPDYVSLETRSVAMELQLHHVCENSDYLHKKVEEAEDELTHLRQKSKAAEHELLKRLDGLDGTSAMNLSMRTKAEEELQAVKEDIAQTRKSIQQEQREVESLNEDITYEEAYHREHLSNVTVVSILLQISSDTTDDTLIDFLHCIVSGEDGNCPNGTAAFPEAGQWLSDLSRRAYHYEGALTRSPCSGPVDWFVLARRNLVSRASFLNFAKGELGKPLEHEKHHLRNSSLEGVQILSSILAEPRFKLEEKNTRTVRFSVVMGLLLVAALLLHAAGLYPADGFLAFIFLLAVPCIVFFVCTLVGVTRYPSPSTDLDVGYGSVHAWQSVTQTLTRTHFQTLLLDLLCTVFTLVVTVFFELYAVAVILIWSLKSPSLLVPPLFLLAFWLLGRVPVVAFTCGAVASCIPVATCVAMFFWFGIPATLVMLMASYILLPAWAWVTGSVTCTDGVDWEVHMTFVIVLVYLSFVWGTLRQAILQGMSFIDRSMVFVFYVLAMADMYTDAVFICIALQCGSHLGYVAFFFYLVGVIVLQLLLPAVSLCLQGSVGNRLLGLWSLFLFPPELLGGNNRGGYHALPVGNAEGLDRCDESLVKFTVMIQAILRIAAEDFPQCVLQYLFTARVKKNPVIMLSIGISIASSFFAVGKAVYRFTR